MLTLHISNGGRVTEQMVLPAPLEEIQMQMAEIRAKGRSNDIFFISKVDSVISALDWHLQYAKLNNDASFQKLNQLAETIDGMDTAGHYHLCRALSTDYQQDLDDVLRTALHVKPSSLDNYEIIPEIKTHQALGRWLVEHDHLKVPEALRPYMDYRSIGMNYCSEHEGVFLTGGYAGIHSDAIEQVLEEQGILQLTLTTSKGEYRINFPATDEHLERVKRTLDVKDFAQASVTAVKCSTPCLTGLLPLDTACVEDANTLSLCLREMEQEDGGIMKFCAVLEVEQPDTFAEALNIAMDRDDYELVPEDMDEYGKQVLRRIGADGEIIDTIDGYMDLAQLGKDSVVEDGVRRTEFGLVRRLSAPFPTQEIGQTMM